MSPASCAAYVAGIQDALIRFEQWGIITSPHSRIVRAADHLRRVAELGTYGESDEELRKTAAAIQLAHDCLHMTSMLGADPQEQMARELQCATGGALDDRALSSAALDVQTQFWFGSWLAQSGLHPNVPRTGSRPTPDYVITVDTFDFAVEVKRLQRLEALRTRLRQAARQLSSPRCPPGIVAIDITSCLDGIDLVGTIDDESTVRQQLAGSFDAAAAHITRYVTAQKARGRFSRWVLLVLYARFLVWVHDPILKPNLGLHFNSPTYPESCSGLVTDQIAKIQYLLVSGLPWMGVERSIVRRTPRLRV
jgi:hypothetical protein